MTREAYALDKEIIEIRKAKADPVDKSYDNIKKWDELLEKITTLYIFIFPIIGVNNNYKELITKLNYMENKYKIELLAYNGVNGLKEAITNHGENIKQYISEISITS